MSPLAGRLSASAGEDATAVVSTLAFTATNTRCAVIILLVLLGTIFAPDKALLLIFLPPATGHSERGGADSQDENSCAQNHNQSPIPLSALHDHLRQVKGSADDLYGRSAKPIGRGRDPERIQSAAETYGHGITHAVFRNGGVRRIPGQFFRILEVISMLILAPARFLKVRSGNIKPERRRF